MNICSSALVIFAALVVSVGVARASPCSAHIAAFQRTLTQEGPDHVASAPQTLGAQLEHQPTPASVAEAKKQASSAVSAAVREAKMLDAQNKSAECEATLAKASLLLRP
jgi:hypothetical protein